MTFNEWNPFYSVLLLLVASAGKSEAQSCGGTFNANYGVLMSPNYPKVYNTSMQCTYTIYPSAMSTITLSFDTFELDRSSNDCVVITCPSNGNSVSKYFYWNFETPPISLTHCTFARVFFYSDANRVFLTRGFRIHYQVSTQDCVNTVFNSSGTLSSPIYPQIYNLNENCTYSIWAPESSSFTLTFEGFDLDENCQRDWVQIRCDNSSHILPKYCGKNLPKPVYISNCNKVLIWFHTDYYSYGSIGFSLQYTVSQDGCGKSNYGGLSGIITSTNFPKRYSRTSCYYYIYPVSSIALDFQSFDLEPFVDSTNGDYVEVDCQSNSSYGILRYYGNTLPPLISYPLCICVRLYFYANNAHSGTGFNVKYHVNPLITNSTIVSAPKNLTVNVGDRVELDCTTNAIGYYVVYPSWTLSRDGTNENTTTIATLCDVNDDYVEGYFALKYTYRQCRLIIHSAKLDQAGVYTCIDIGLASASAILTVVVNSSVTTTVSTTSVTTATESIITGYTCTESDVAVIVLSVLLVIAVLGYIGITIYYIIHRSRAKTNSSQDIKLYSMFNWTLGKHRDETCESIFEHVRHCKSTYVRQYPKSTSPVGYFQRCKY